MSNHHPQRGRQITGRLSGQPIPQNDVLRGTTMYPRECYHIVRCPICHCPTPEDEMVADRCLHCRPPEVVM